MAAVWEQNFIVTSYDFISRGWGPEWKHFLTYYLSFKFRCHSFNIRRVKRWGRNPPSPARSHKTKKSPVWIGLKLVARFISTTIWLICKVSSIQNKIVLLCPLRLVSLLSSSSSKEPGLETSLSKEELLYNSKWRKSFFHKWQINPQ